MLTNSFLIKKGDFFIHQKHFSQRFLLNQLYKTLDSDLLKTSDISSLMNTSNILNIKTSLYSLLKLLKEQKRKNINGNQNSSLANLDKISFQLQASGLYTSFVELKKRQKLTNLRATILEFYVFCLLKHYKKSIAVGDSKTLKKEFFDKKAYKVFYNKLKKSKFNITSKTTRKKKFRSLAVLRQRYTKIFNRRLFLFLKTHKIKYKKVLTYARQDKLKMKRIFNLLPRTKVNFILEKREFYKEYKKLVLKYRKRRNRKKTGLFFFLRRRRRLLHKYHVPRHLEINYKTFDVAHLGQFDLQTTSSRITFWLNLRRLITFLSM